MKKKLIEILIFFTGSILILISITSSLSRDGKFSLGWEQIVLLLAGIVTILIGFLYRKQNDQSQFHQALSSIVKAFESQKRKKIFFFVLLSVISIVASLYILYSTHFSYSGWGFSDSAVYFASAQNFADGKGLGVVNPDGNFRRLTIFPPLYSLSLGLMVKIGMNIFTAARTIDVLTFGLLIFLIGFFTYSISNSIVLSLSFSLVTFINYQMIIAYTSLLSEPLAYLFGLSSLFLTILYILHKKNSLLILSGLSGSLCVLTRYAFIVFPIINLFLLLIFHEEGLKKKIAAFFTSLLLSLSPVTVWLGSEFFYSKTIGARRFVLESTFLNTAILLQKEINAIVKTWIPYRSDMILSVEQKYMNPILLILTILYLTIGIILLFIKIKNHKVKNEPLVVTSVGFILLFICYFVFVLATNVFMDFSAIRERILAPLILFSFGIFFSFLLLIRDFAKEKRITIWAICLVFVYLFTRYNYPLVLQSLTKYNEPSPVWVNKPIFEEIRSIDFNKSDLIFSNGPDIILYYTAIYPRYIQETMVSDSGLLVNNGENPKEDQCQVLILFPPEFIDPLQRQENPITIDSINRMKSTFNLYYSGSEGVVLYNDQCTNLHIKKLGKLELVAD